MVDPSTLPNSKASSVHTRITDIRWASPSCGCKNSVNESSRTPGSLGLGFRPTYSQGSKSKLIKIIH